MNLPMPAPKLLEMLQERSGDPATLKEILRRQIGPTQDGRYRHWHKLRFLTPPDGLTHHQWWMAIKLARGALLKDLPLTDGGGSPYRLAMVDPLLEKLRQIDRDASGQIQVSEQVTSPATRDRYLVSQLIEEAITSSQLEGAATTHRVAEDMLRSGRPPISRDERMIVNNFLAMRSIRELKDKPLTVEYVQNLHRIVTEGTLENPQDAGRLRTEEDGVVVRDPRDGEILHMPPPADQLSQRLDLMCAFANGEIPGYFLHPVVRAVVLHFWVAYDHPFVDGNGRTARALFYWSMLRQNYWLTEFLSISSVLRKAAGKYRRAYLYSESDENDVTYFVLFQLDVLLLAIKALHRFLRKKMEELQETQSLLRRSRGLNHRQIALLGHALRNPGATYTIESHRRSHDVVYQTARTDLLTLARRGLLRKRRAGRAFVFLAPKDLGTRLRQ